MISEDLEKIAIEIIRRNYNRMYLDFHPQGVDGSDIYLKEYIKIALHKLWKETIEDCAKICDQAIFDFPNGIPKNYDNLMDAVAAKCAAKIRAYGGTNK